MLLIINIIATIKRDERLFYKVQNFFVPRYSFIVLVMMEACIEPTFNKNHEIYCGI